MVNVPARAPAFVVDQLRAASYWSRQSIRKIVERALRHELGRLSMEHFEGAECPQEWPEIPEK